MSLFCKAIFMTPAQDKPLSVFTYVKSRRIVRIGLGVGLGLWGLLLAGCGGQNNPKDPDAIYIKAGYVQAPKITSVTRLTDGSVHIIGRAVPDGRVRVASDENRAIGISANAKGVFQIDLPPQTSGHLYELSMDFEGREIRAEGRLFVSPTGTGHMVLLRSGAPSLPLSPDAPLIAVVDLDRAGAAAVSGRATPNSEIAISVDGQPLTHATADAKGNYSASLPLIRDHPVASLRLTAQTQNQSQTVDIRFDGTYPKIGPQTPVVVAKLNPGWRVAWTLPGGGAQLSLIY
jgi:hypothetical protein